MADGIGRRFTLGGRLRRSREEDTITLFTNVRERIYTVSELVKKRAD